MAYGILLSEVAQEDIRQIKNPQIREFVLRQLEILAEYPTALSRPSHFPYREKCQIFRFDCDHELQRYEFNALFQYSADEQHIHILAIGRSIRDPWDGIDPLPGAGQE